MNIIKKKIVENSAMIDTYADDVRIKPNRKKKQESIF